MVRVADRGRRSLMRYRVNAAVLRSHLKKCARRLEASERQRLGSCVRRSERALAELGKGNERGRRVLFSWRRFVLHGGVVGARDAFEVAVPWRGKRL